MPTIAAARAAQAAAAAQGPTAQLNTGNGIDYHGGPIVPSMKVAAVYWSSSAIYAGGPAPGTRGTGAQDGSLVGYYLNNLAGSTYYNINTTYGDTVAPATPWPTPSPTPAIGPTTTTRRWQTRTFRTRASSREIVFGFTSGNLTYDPATIYAVFSANNVNLGGGAYTQYCAYHSWFRWNGQNVLYAVMPYNWSHPTSCSALNGSPNNDFGADAEVNVLTHELEETNTDPQLNAWYDSVGNENADKCAWTFGTTYTTSNGATANIQVGARDWLVQQQWLNANGGLCVKSYVGSTVPAAPVLNSATAGNARVVLGWSNPTSDGGSPITGYVVNRGTASGGETQLAQIGKQLTYTDSTAVNGTTYYYTVQATNAVGSSVASNELSATPAGPPTVPGAPTLNSATAGNGTVALGWSAPASDGGSPITGYVVNRGTTSGGETQLVQLGVQTTYTDTTAVNGTTYYYTVQAKNTVGTGSASAERSATPAAADHVPGAPALNSATAGNGNVALGWSAPASDGGSPITGYVVNRGTTSGGETQLVLLGVQTSYTDTTAVNGTTYYYTVQARNIVGTGVASGERSATPSGPPPPGIRFVQTIGTATLSKAGNTSLTISVPAGGVAAGDSVIVSVTAGTFGGAVACSDTKGNVYSVDADVTSVGRLFICSARNVTALTSSDKITATYPGFSGMSAATASEFAGHHRRRPEAHGEREQRGTDLGSGHDDARQRAGFRDHCPQLDADADARLRHGRDQQVRCGHGRRPEADRPRVPGRIRDRNVLELRHPDSLRPVVAGGDRHLLLRKRAG